MTRVIVGLILIIVGLGAFARRKSTLPAGRLSAVAGLIGVAGGTILTLAGLLLLASASFVLIPADRVGHLKRIYLADDLPSGRIIALAG